MTAKFSGITHKIFIEQDASSTQISTDTITNIDMFVGTQDLAKKGDTAKISLQSVKVSLSESFIRG